MDAKHAFFYVPDLDRNCVDVYSWGGKHLSALNLNELSLEGKFGVACEIVASGEVLPDRGGGWRLSSRRFQSMIYFNDKYLRMYYNACLRRVSLYIERLAHCRGEDDAKLLNQQIKGMRDYLSDLRRHQAEEGARQVPLVILDWFSLRHLDSTKVTSEDLRAMIEKRILSEKHSG